jgi:aspartyl-tRNA(Asn)/glutamyl-tRNA(Gln) amidotransferase subunit A
MSDLTGLPMRQLMNLLSTRKISSVELTHAYIDRIQSLEGNLHAFITFTPELALERAGQADDRRSAGGNGDLPPLLGLPIVAKDVLSVEGLRCTCGSKILEDYIPPYTATSVQRLLDAGVVILGKTNTDEFAMGSSTENSAYGVTHNPWDPSRVPGGSSGGSAAAVAAGMAPAALGTDTGGSVRQPASFCGITGLKPTYGRVSRYGLIAYGSSLDSVGVLARSAEDIAALFPVMAGHDPRDATSARVEIIRSALGERDNLRGVRVGIPAEYFAEGLQPDVENSVRSAIGKMESLGAEIHAVSLPHTKYAVPVYYLVAPAEASANLSRYDGIRFGLQPDADTLLDRFIEARSAGFGAEAKRRIMLGTYALSAGYYDAFYAQAQKVRTLIKRDFETVFKEVDMIAAPVAPTTAFKIGGHGDDPLAMYLEDIYTLPANLAGIPGLAFPVGFDGVGLPIGMQLMGKPFDEKLLLESVHVFQQNTDWHLKVPHL